MNSLRVIYSGDLIVLNNTSKTILNSILHYNRSLGGQLAGALLYRPQGRVRFRMWSLEFVIDLIIPAALWPKLVLGISFGSKGGRSICLTTLPSLCAECLENS